MALSVVTATMTPSISNNSELDEDSFSSLSSSYVEPFDVVDKSWISVVMGVIVLITVTGNIFVMLAFSQDRKIQSTVSNLFILNLSVADCIVGAIILPINTSWYLLDYWPYGKIFCQIWIVIDYTTAYMSVLMITLISLDRFWLVTKKLRYQDFQTRRQVKIMIAVCWMFSVSLYATVTFAWEPIVGESVIDYSDDCEMESLYNTPFNISLMFFEFLIPLIVISVLNSIVYANIKRRSKGMVKPPVNPKPKPSKSTESLDTENSTISANGSTNGTANNNGASIESISLKVSSTPKPATPKVPAKKKANKEDKKREFARHRKAAITLAIIVGMFLVCWLPSYVTTIWTAVCDECVSDIVWELTNNILWCNSAINPFLYAFTNLHYRRNFTRFLGIQKLLKRYLPSETKVSTI